VFFLLFVGYLGSQYKGPQCIYFGDSDQALPQLRDCIFGHQYLVTVRHPERNWTA